MGLRRCYSGIPLYKGKERLGKSPFGSTGSGIDLRSYWMGLKGCEWVESRKGRIKHEMNLKDLPHTHHAGDDARELAAVFEAILNNR